MARDRWKLGTLRGAIGLLVVGTLVVLAESPASADDAKVADGAQVLAVVVGVAHVVDGAGGEVDELVGLTSCCDSDRWGGAK